MNRSHKASPRYGIAPRVLLTAKQGDGRGWRLPAVHWGLTQDTQPND
jgi:hypothetical protein